MQYSRENEIARWTKATAADAAILRKARAERRARARAERDGYQVALSAVYKQALEAGDKAHGARHELSSHPAAAERYATLIQNLQAAAAELHDAVEAELKTLAAAS